MKKLSFFILISFIFIGFVSAQSITVTSPHAGDTWCIGSTHNITWTKTGNAGVNVKINIFKDQIDQAHYIPDSQIKCLNSGTKSWQIPNTYANGTYYIRIKGGDSNWNDTGVHGDSGAFMIKACLTSITSQLNINPKITKESVTLVPRPNLKLYSPMIGFLPGKCNKVKFYVGIRNKGTVAAANVPFRLKIDGPQGTTYDNFILNGVLSCATIPPNMSCNFTKTLTLNAPGMYYYTFAIDPNNEFNLFKKITKQIVQQNPDLIVFIRQPKDPKLTLKRNVYFFVKNQGTACSKPSVLKTYMEKKGSKNHNIPHLRPGDIYKIKRGEKWFTLGTRKITAAADYTNVINEGKQQFENNNTDEISVKVRIVGYKTYTWNRLPPAGFFENSTIINE